MPAAALHDPTAPWCLRTGVVEVTRLPLPRDGRALVASLRAPDRRRRQLQALEVFELLGGHPLRRRRP